MGVYSPQIFDGTTSVKYFTAPKYLGRTYILGVYSPKYLTEPHPSNILGVYRPHPSNILTPKYLGRTSVKYFGGLQPPNI